MELLKKEAESVETVQSLTEENKKIDKVFDVLMTWFYYSVQQLKEAKQLETERIKYLEEEIQVLTAQVNAYSRECEKQKGLVAQNQEKHKSEVYTCMCCISIHLTCIIILDPRTK